MSANKNEDLESEDYCLNLDISLQQLREFRRSNYKHYSQSEVSTAQCEEVVM